MKVGLVIGIVAVIVAIGLLIATSTTRGPRYRLQACIFFGGRFNCKTVSARSEQGAIRSAIQNACADIASGVTEVVNCESTEPKSLKWLERPRADK